VCNVDFADTSSALFLNHIDDTQVDVAIASHFRPICFLLSSSNAFEKHHDTQVQGQLCFIVDFLFFKHKNYQK
jgi:hypothetical protein